MLSLTKQLVFIAMRKHPSQGKSQKEEFILDLQFQRVRVQDGRAAAARRQTARATSQSQFTRRKHKAQLLEHVTLET